MSCGQKRDTVYSKVTYSSAKTIHATHTACALHCTRIYCTVGFAPPAELPPYTRMYNSRHASTRFESGALITNQLIILHHNKHCMPHMRALVPSQPHEVKPILYSNTVFLYHQKYKCVLVHIICYARESRRTRSESPSAL